MIYAIIVILVLDVWGISIAPFLAGAGIFGFAIALGAQDLFKNLISGLLVVGEQRMEVGDFVELGQTLGTVEKVVSVDLQFGAWIRLLPSSRTA